MRASTPGRPRAIPGRPGVEPRQEILDAAAALFAERGYAATSTRQIAERAGMRQASLYYHFGGKEEILLALLQASVLPTLERAADFLDEPDPREALRELAMADVRTLLEEPHNIGTMYLSPETAAEPFAPFRAARAELARVYGTLAQRIDPTVDGAFAGACCMQLVELVITLRRDGAATDGIAERIADACLRVVDAPA
ncbi:MULTISPECIES: TetR/AcrR family transcriptional regulator [unclassified Microbacterium]|uniref:TetR/AcrR family transcriptional regulator n=1 Tax=Microbacterium TaxID=33882 RepID=UPI003B9F9E71